MHTYLHRVHLRCLLCCAYTTIIWRCCASSATCKMTSCGLAYNVRWTVGSEAMFKGDKECW